MSTECRQMRSVHYSGTALAAAVADRAAEGEAVAAPACTVSAD